ncbi:hypothetical protein [Brunnivagina elsteri]|uniref:Uncharacterized protein n=1 Tax=Brunnivagina elsteri CCALA 953 TaxID=987040 RepID=A0A2A2THN1_9CYAN|nr:hypothetical protein [Calothrix elsteri]PAX53254.1 hypothetical protein CK510_14965 [Calothrix elsteri CCALA 953]
MVSFYPGQKANELAKAAQERYEYALKQLKIEEAETNKLAEEYGEIQLNIIRDTIKRFVEFLERTGRKASESEKRFLEGMDFSVQQLKECKAAAIGAEQYFMEGAKAAGAAAASYGGAIGVATSIGAASTGTAISSLSGAAAWNATLAWFGGGAIAAGGGGMALGTIVLGGITVLPALAIGGFFAASEGEKAMTKAREYQAKVNKAVTEINATKDYSQQVKRRITELREIFESLNNRAVLGLDELEYIAVPKLVKYLFNAINPGKEHSGVPEFLRKRHKTFDPKRDAEQFQQVALLIKGLVEILKTPILDNEAKLNLGTVPILEKYRTLPGK